MMIFGNGTEMVSTKTAKRDKTPPLTPSTIIHQFIISSPFPSLPFRKSTPSRPRVSSEPSFVELFLFNIEFRSNLSTSEQFPLPSIVFVRSSCSKRPLNILLQSQFVFPYIFALLCSGFLSFSRSFRI